MNILVDWPIPANLTNSRANRGSQPPGRSMMSFSESSKRPESAYRANNPIDIRKTSGPRPKRARIAGNMTEASKRLPNRILNRMIFRLNSRPLSAVPGIRIVAGVFCGACGGPVFLKSAPCFIRKKGFTRAIKCLKCGWQKGYK